MTNQKGQIMILSIIVLGVVMVSTLVTIGGAQVYFSNANYSAEAEKATAIAEAGIDKAIESLNKTGGTYAGDEEVIVGDGSFSTVVTTKDAATKVIESTGFIPNKSESKVKRTVKILASKGVGVSFVYGIQVGEGGLELGNGNIISGSIYSNGNILAGNNNQITGDAWVAGGPQPNPDQQIECVDSNCVDYLFGKNINGEDRLDLAQSFVMSETNALNKISIKVKKFGNPADVMVRIMRDNNGRPDKNGVLATGTLYSNLVTSNYSWIDVTFTSSPSLSSGTTYWLMIDTISNNNNYWSWQNDLAQSYSSGLPKWSANWNVGSPTWISFNGDLNFKTFSGGSPTSFYAGNGTTIGGDVHANMIDNLDISGDAFYQVIGNSSVSGTSHPNSEDPSPKVLPISDANITEWKQQAESIGVTNGDISGCPVSLGPGKIIGNATFDNSCTVTMNSPIWITGDITLSNSNTLKLSSDYGATSGVIIIDGIANLGNGNKLEGSGIENSLLMLLSTYDSRFNGISAIKINNTGNSGVFYAGVGTIEPGNGNAFIELTAWKIKLVHNSSINYEQGLSSTLFSSGPSGSFSLIKGTYQVK